MHHHPLGMNQWRTDAITVTRDPHNHKALHCIGTGVEVGRSTCKQKTRGASRACLGGWREYEGDRLKEREMQ